LPPQAARDAMARAAREWRRVNGMDGLLGIW
jgi:hypothetical protein